MKKLTKVLNTIFICAILLGGTDLSACAQIPATDNSQSSVTPFADIIDWRYKVENNKMYKRLYNYTQQVWVGEWILVS